MTTKEAIIYESLKLFSVHGFDSVSTRMIARAVDASDAVIYKHFKNKQEILDTIVEVCRKRFVEKRQSANLQNMHWVDVERVCMDMFYFQTHDEWIVMFRKLLTIEQFKNPKMAELFKIIFIDTAIDGMTYMFTELIKAGYLKEGNPRVYAMELYGPFFMYHTVNTDDEELLKELEEHVRYFRKNYRT